MRGLWLNRNSKMHELHAELNHLQSQLREIYKARTLPQVRQIVRAALKED